MKDSAAAAIQERDEACSAAHAMGEDRLDAGALFRAHGHFVASFLVKLGVDPSELEDAVQDVFVVAHQRGGFVAGAARPTTWLAEIACRVASTRRRTRRRRPESMGDQELALAASPQSLPSDVAEASQGLRRVQQALMTLELGYRAVFILYELEGESCETIAAGLGIPVGTVYSRLHKARKQFSEAHARLVAAPARSAR
jgi:RNA polymerase sigma-70 factor (ECF subfamily)